MANIVFDDGKKVELSKETTERLKKELLSNIPNIVRVGQVYKTKAYKYIVASLGDGKGLTIVGGICSGCFSSDVLTGTRSGEELREILVRRNAEYLGDFDEVFKLKS